MTRVVTAPRSSLLSSLSLSLLLAVAPAVARAQRPAPAPSAATRAVYLDSAGVIRWADDRREVALFGANYTLPSASDFRAAGYLTNDRKKLIDEDMAQFARMGWDGLRLASWGDWENADSVGNLIPIDARAWFVPDGKRLSARASILLTLIY